jgi:hypothetical protein
MPNITGNKYTYILEMILQVADLLPVVNNWFGFKRAINKISPGAEEEHYRPWADDMQGFEKNRDLF